MKNWTKSFKNQKGQSLLELIFMLPIYVLVMIVLFEMTVMFFYVFKDFSEVRNKALKGAKEGNATRAACYEEKRNHNIKIGLIGGVQTYETKIKLWTYGDGPSNC